MNLHGHAGSCNAVKRATKSSLFLSVRVALIICLVFPWKAFSQTVEEIQPALPRPNYWLAQGPDAVKGVVLNSVTREPIPRALVTTNDYRYAALTDDRGYFGFVFPPHESEPVMGEGKEEEQRRTLRQWLDRNRRPLYITGRKPGFVAEDATVFIPRTNGGTAELQVLLKPEAVIVGHVRFPDEDSFDKANVRLYRQEFAQGQQLWKMVRYFNTYADGEFRFYNLAPGVYKVFTADHPQRAHASLNRNDQLYGLPPVYFHGASYFSAATPIHLVAGKHVEANISLTRREYYAVEVTIVNYSSTQPPRVQVFPQGHPGPGYSLEYVPSNRSLRGFLPDGEYTLRITSAGEEQDGSQDEQKGSSGTANFNVHGAPTTVSIAMLPNITITVIVKTVFSHPDMDKVGGETDDIEVREGFSEPVTVSLASVNAYDQEQSYVSDHSPDDPVDLVKVADVVPGDYRLSVESQRGYVSTATWNGADVLEQQVTIRPDGGASPIEVTVRDDGAELSGSVQVTSDAKTQTAYEAQIYVYMLPITGVQRQFRHLAPNSGFTFDQVAPGTYRILAFEREHRELNSVDSQTLQTYEGRGIEVTLSANQKLNLSEPLRVVKEP